MADSSSESEATFDIEEVPEDNRDHVREVLAKGKQIIPYYSVHLTSFRTMPCTSSIKDTTKLITSSTTNSRWSLIIVKSKTAVRGGLLWEILKDRQKNKNTISFRTNNVRIYLFSDLESNQLGQWRSKAEA